MTQQCHFQLYTSNIAENRTRYQQMYAYCEITALIKGVYYSGFSEEGTEPVKGVGKNIDHHKMKVNFHL